MRAHGFDPRLLEFELTESTLMSHAEDSVAILDRLKARGIKLSLDDFGTGYSSLAYLKRFPIDTLKIDRAFIRDVTTNSDDAAITVAVIGMAHNLKLQVVAEGVETREQFDFLRRHQCDQIQGYYVSRPLPAEEITELLGRGGRFEFFAELPASCEVNEATLEAAEWPNPLSQRSRRRTGTGP
jgi:EAL domain-containing protein (putative c-di-GMP-specific phosphodiesterase class I)